MLVVGLYLPERCRLSSDRLVAKSYLYQPLKYIFPGVWNEALFFYLRSFDLT
jgi:hypothetical protein